jgi:hypothetical protein
MPEVIQSHQDKVAILITAGEWIIDRKECIVTGPQVVPSMTQEGVIVIRRVVRATDETVEVWKVNQAWAMLPPKGWAEPAPETQTLKVDPKETTEAGMWIPWADNPNQYRTHHATIQVGGRVLAYIWQSGRVRFGVENQSVADGPEVPGVSRSVGDRVLVIARTPEGLTGFWLRIRCEEASQAGTAA